ncbi:DNA replication complex GINS protein SLD5 isoform X2 [Alnus glutinosa]|uniref:DNA replication complex GINS protein SLD5 isoform X2 n=1 Tax=Alnus glutinosa TaxID=3517 RepID=UPI002D79CE8F|nr:DNA replication complex GINS protein SLD5 isoform X2 [Alnus glutinosa]
MASGSTAGMDDDYEALISTTDMELLKRAWRNEKAAPEILRFETALIQRIRGQIQLMIGKYMFHISNNPEVQNRLSEQEKGFAKRCTEDMERHLEESVLSKLPDNYQAMLKQSIISEENDMVPEPQLDTFVVCKSRRFLGPFQLDGSDELLEMKPDDLCIIHYKSIRERVQEGEIDLV